MEATGFFIDLKSVLAPVDPGAEADCPLVQPPKTQTTETNATTKIPDNECRIRRKSNKENQFLGMRLRIFSPSARFDVLGTATGKGLQGRSSQTADESELVSAGAAQSLT